MAGPAIVYGTPRADLVSLAPGAVQTSPLIPGSTALEDLADASAAEVTVMAPPGSLERSAVLAHALRILAPGGALTALAPKDKGGARLKKTLEAFGGLVSEDARRHHRICRCVRPEHPAGLDAAIAAGAPQRVAALGLWSQPGVFSWDRLDPGSALLLENLPPLSGRGADLGCGIGVLARRILQSPKVKALALIDSDRRAVAAARRNLDDPRAGFAWADARQPGSLPEQLDFVVMNPPFHDGGHEDRGLGLAFIAAAARILRPGASLWMVANRGLPYEAALEAAFKQVERRADLGGYKVHEARR